MTDLLRYRQPVPVTLALALMVAALVWTVATLVTGTDALWFRMVYCAAVVAMTPFALEPVSVALALDPDNRWFRFVYGVYHGFLLVLLVAAAGFPYVQTASVNIKLAVLLVAIVFGVMATIRSPQPPDYVLQDYDRSKMLTGWVSIIYIPIVLLGLTYILLTADLGSTEQLSKGGAGSIFIASVAMLVTGGPSSKRLLDRRKNSPLLLLVLAVITYAVFFLLHR